MFISSDGHAFIGYCVLHTPLHQQAYTVLTPLFLRPLAAITCLRVLKLLRLPVVPLAFKSKAITVLIVSQSSQPLFFGSPPGPPPPVIRRTLFYTFLAIIRPRSFSP